MRWRALICLLLAGITLAIYWPATHFTFIYYDDPSFLLCPEVATGLSPMGIDWIMKGIVASNWHPLTLFSFLLIHQFFGLNPGVEHLVNILFHTANAVLLFLVLLQMTGAMWRSAIVAAIFAWHPLHVESVAWIAERKDVLFTFFMLLSLWCYALYARPAGKNAPENSRSKTRDAARKAPRTATIGELTARRGVPAISSLSRQIYYNLAFVFFILSFLSKAMVVTLPFLLLLLDYWPLQRLNRSTFRSLIFEKIRYFAATIFFCFMTFQLQKGEGAVVPLGQIGMADRLENTVLNYVKYLGRFFWPVDLAFPYPLTDKFDTVQVWLTTLLLLGISALCFLQWSRRPWLALGWFWYLGTMVPVCGIVQLSMQGMADRYTYITLIGPTISLVWLVWDWVRNHPSWKCLVASTTAVALAVCAVLTERQLQFWRDTVTVFGHTLAIIPDDAVAESVLALGLEHEGLLSQAAVHYRMAIAQYNADFMPNFHLGKEMAEMAYFHLGTVMAKMGYYREAEARLDEALKVAPNSPDGPVAKNNLAWLLATSPDPKARDGPRAVQLAQQACELTHYRNPVFMTTLATAYAEAGRFDDAIDMTQKAIALANQYGLEPWSKRNQELWQIFSNHQTYAQTHPGQLSILPGS